MSGFQPVRVEEGRRATSGAAPQLHARSLRSIATRHATTTRWPLHSTNAVSEEFRCRSKGTGPVPAPLSCPRGAPRRGNLSHRPQNQTCCADPAPSSTEDDESPMPTRRAMRTHSSQGRFPHCPTARCGRRRAGVVLAIAGQLAACRVEFPQALTLRGESCLREYCRHCTAWHVRHPPGPTSCGAAIAAVDARRHPASSQNWTI